MSSIVIILSTRVRLIGHRVAHAIEEILAEVYSLASQVFNHAKVKPKELQL